MTTDYYNTLGVQRGASQEEIKKAYRGLAAKHHPDRGGDTAKFQELQEAYATLSDEQKRAEYDNPQPQFGGFGGGPHVDIFAQFFGGRPGQNPFGFRQQIKRNKTINIRAQVSLLEVITGKEIIGSIRLPSGRDQALQIKIPPGVNTGDSIKFTGLGDDSIPNIPRGDLIATIEEIPHDRFHRQGIDLYSTHHISVFDLIVGSVISFETVEGSTIQVTIPPNTNPGATLSCAGYGVPLSNSNIRGNLFIKIAATMPKNVTPEDLEVIKTLQLKYNS